MKCVDMVASELLSVIHEATSKVDFYPREPLDHTVSI